MKAILTFGGREFETIRKKMSSKEQRSLFPTSASPRKSWL